VIQASSLASPMRVELQPSAVSAWTTRDLARWGVFVGAGASAWMVAWYLASGDRTFGSQIAPVDVAVIGLVVACAADIWILLMGRRAIGVRRRLLVGEAAPLATGTSVSAVASARPGSDELVGQTGLRHFHRADCPMARNKTWSAAERHEHEHAGRRPCGICQP
jgi:hypothetical protein